MTASRDRVSVAIAGSGGAGVMTVGALLLQAAAKAGYYGLFTRLAGAQVRGGEAAALVTLGTAYIETPPDRARGRRGTARRRRLRPGHLLPRRTQGECPGTTARYRPRFHRKGIPRMKGLSGIRTVADFFAHALALEREAATRYLQFSEQMLTHNNREVAELFETLAQLESGHHGRLQDRCRALAPTALKPWEYRWIDPESPESAPLDATHYLMTPWHAVRIALVNELRAQRFFEAIAASPDATAEVRALATEFAVDEHEHAGHLERMLAQLPAPLLHDWEVDTDPPVAVD